MRDEPDLRATTQGELLQLVPYLLGFHPAESLVLVCLRERRVACTARVDLDAIRDADAVVELLTRVAGRARADRIVAVAYAATRDPAHHALDLVESAAVDLEVQDLIWVQGARWESLCDQGGGYVEPSGALAAEAVYRGLSAAGSRAAVVSAVEPADVAADWQRRHADARRRVSRWSRARRRQRLEQVLARSAGADLDPDTAAETAVLVADPVIRDVALTAITAESAPELLALWLGVVRALPDADCAVHALGLFGMCAWQAGEGALVVAAIERAERIGAEAGLISLLGMINELALPPQWWQQIREELVA